MAYRRVTSSISTILNTLNFEQLRQAYVQEINLLGSTLSNKLVPELQKAKSVNGFLYALEFSRYWNWFDIKLLQSLVNASGSSEAKLWLESFKAFYHKKSLSDIIPYLNTMPLNGVIKLVEKLEKNLKDLRVSELLQHKYQIESEVLTLNEGELILSGIKLSCAELTWFIPQELVYKAFNSMKKKHNKYHLFGIKSLYCQSAEEYSGLPYLWHGQKVHDSEVGPIEPLPSYIREKPYSLPNGFRWVTLTKDDIQEIFRFMNMKSSSNLNSIKFNFSHPNGKCDWNFGIRTAKGTLVGVALGHPTSIHIRGKLIQCLSPIIENHKNYDDKRLWFMLHTELHRRSNLYKINQFVYNGGHDLLKPFVVFTKWYTFLANQHFFFTVTRGWRKMTPEDVPGALRLVNNYSSQFEVGTIYNNAEDFAHVFLCSEIPNLVATYIVENDNKITDLVSYNCISTQADVSAIVSTSTPVEQLIRNMLISARNNSIEVISLLQHNMSRDFLLSLGFLPDQLPHYLIYLFNYQYTEVSEADCFYPS